MSKVILLILFTLPFYLRAQSCSDTLLQNNLRAEWHNKLNDISKNFTDSNCVGYYLRLLNNESKEGALILDSLICLYNHFLSKNEIDLMSISISYSQGDDTQIMFDATYYFKDKTLNVYYDAMQTKWTSEYFKEQKYALINKEKMLYWIDEKSCFECACSTDPMVLSLIKDGKIIKTKISVDNW